MLRPAELLRRSGGMSLLAVDLGLRTGLALYGADGRLRWYRSQNYGSAERLRRAVYAELNAMPELRVLQTGLLDAIPMELRR